MRESVDPWDPATFKYPATRPAYPLHQLYLKETQCLALALGPGQEAPGPSPWPLVVVALVPTYESIPVS